MQAELEGKVAEVRTLAQQALCNSQQPPAQQQAQQLMQQPVGAGVPMSCDAAASAAAHEGSLSAPDPTAVHQQGQQVRQPEAQDQQAHGPDQQVMAADQQALQQQVQQLAQQLETFKVGRGCVGHVLSGVS